MPIVTIKLAGGIKNKDLQNEIANDITEIFTKKLNKAKERVVLSFEEIPSEDIYFGGISVEDIKKG